VTEAEGETGPSAGAEGHVVTVPKALEAEAANQDAAAFDDAVGRYAVSDGVSRSTRAALFSRALVEEVVRSGLPRPAELPAWLRPPQQTWAEGNEERRKQAQTWYAKTPGHGAATLAAAAVSADGASVEIFAVGDSCVFHVRGGELLTLYPPLKLGDFGFAPPSLSSDPSREPPEAGAWTAAAAPGDALLLATDALAKWVLTALERGDTAVLRRMLSFRRAEGQQDFERFVAQERAEGRLDDDDTTLLTVVLRTPTAADVVPPAPADAPVPAPLPERRPSARPPRPSDAARRRGAVQRRAAAPLALGCAAFFLGGVMLLWCAVRSSSSPGSAAGSAEPGATASASASAPGLGSASAQHLGAAPSLEIPREPVDAGKTMTSAPARTSRSSKSQTDGGPP
jgi:hypothetical protein